ncbi:Crp/Fnr family transcriptional regulator [Flavobacterium kingsejongi]|uniref:Crp/Fnr family transcriptional regulator n=1 Tax=Flavobacterium kingsejongi TaxID=1678728 RepID=UPI001D132324|nr:Crp/Fnr family transcriptional regulator [Flavobacterium kingsejongi]
MPLDPEEVSLLSSCFEKQQYSKKELLLEAGKNCNSLYFVSRGCLRLYILNQKGTEQTIQFAIENWWLTDYLSFSHDKPSAFAIQAVENSEILCITKEARETLFQRIPKLERYFRIVLQLSYGASQMRINYLFTMSAEERYHHFNAKFPEFVQRIPQYMLASYLDFTPEFLSKIRAGKP